MIGVDLLWSRSGITLTADFLGWNSLDLGLRLGFCSGFKRCRGGYFRDSVTPVRFVERTCRECTRGLDSTRQNNGKIR